MKLLREVLVAYDVEDNKRRSRLHEALKDIGLQPIQYSVFWGLILGAEERAVKRLFRLELDRKTDKAFLVPVRTGGQSRVATFGYVVNPFEKPERYDVT